MNVNHINLFRLLFCRGRLSSEMNLKEEENRPMTTPGEGSMTLLFFLIALNKSTRDKR